MVGSAMSIYSFSFAEYFGRKALSKRAVSYLTLEHSLNI